ncbi:MAG TPA: glycine C-acetyltransferase [Candidatus Polarisedimenticolaceae bacterium]|nr:glycine C-acetyltransferase [Candidatus Polarisedimenticolaceae bacterium]
MKRGWAQRLGQELEGFRRDGVYKRLNHLDSPQAARVRMEGRGEVVVLSSNNYLGLCDVPEIVAAGQAGLERFGAGTGSVRFICGTFTVHRELEQALAGFVGSAAALTYVSCWNANEGLMPTVLDESDVVISDALNHASIIDSVRLCKAQRRVYAHSDMGALETALRESAAARTRFVITDGVFSMEGDIARLPEIVELARKHDAVVAVDDSHATGVLGARGRGSAEHYGMLGEIDVITSTLGKALGGAAGGFTAGPTELVDYLVQRSRPQLFSNALPPTVAASALAAVRYVEAHPERLARLRENTEYFRGRLAEGGFRPLPGQTPIVPVIVGETALAIRMSERLLEHGVFVTGFGYPVVPQGHARLRCQISAGHSRDDLDLALEAFARVGREVGLV